MTNPPSSSSDRLSSEKDTSIPRNASQPLEEILQYISAEWGRLTRSLNDCRTFEDIKTDDEPALYIPDNIPFPQGLTDMRQHCDVRVERLPCVAGKCGSEIRHHGLLYLPNPYVVPGGQFNEMYGWDSYFIIRGLLRDHREELAKGMVENFFYEIEHYGGVLNANRTYYLGRSQPPFLTSMILAIHGADKSTGPEKLEWLERAYRFAVQDYDEWNRPPHLAGDTGLSRYFDEGEGPVPEILGDPEVYYRGAAHFFLMHGQGKSPYLIPVNSGRSASLIAGPVFDVSLVDHSDFHNSNGMPADYVGLTPNFYRGDRSMRESGFDVTFRFGPYGADTHHFAPVCLNSLLYKTEQDLGLISSILDRPDDVHAWTTKAQQRHKNIVKYLWNDCARLFFDYDFVAGAQSSYEYASTFYPLWSGLASADQARAVASNLPLFEQAGGLAMSRLESQAQWDYPYGWAPIHLLAAEGLRRYGYSADADRITYKFLAMIMLNFRRDRVIREKYDVVTQSYVTHIKTGYTENEIGFGWTNGVFLELLHESPAELLARLNKI